MEFDALSNRLIGAAIEVHRELGPGLLESAYQKSLSRELDLQGIPHQCELSMPVIYKGVEIECGYRIDILVDDQNVLELKSVKELLPIHQAQILTYMRLSGKKIGLLMNFNQLRIKDGLKRFVL